MSHEKSEAVVLWGVEYSESSRILTLLTPRRGRLSCIAKGVRRKNSALAPILDTYNRVEAVYSWKDGRQVQTLMDAALLDAYAGIKSDLERSAYAAFPVELAAKVAHENEPSEELYAVLVRGLESLARWTGDVRGHAAWQALQLTSAAGFGPALEYCCRCGGSVSGRAHFSLAGGVVCERCPGERALTPEQWEDLKRLALAQETCPAVGDSGAMFQLVRAYAAHQIEADFRSVRVLHELFP